MLPTSEEMASFGEWLFWSHVESSLEPRLPFGAQLAIQGRHLTVTLGNGKRVVAGVVDRPTSCWAVAYDGVSHALPLETNRDSIIDFVAAAATAIHEGRPIASPYRWGQLERSPVLDVADLLAARGLEIRSAVTVNRMIAGDGRSVWVSETEGHFLEVSDWDQLDIRLRWHKGCGWVADATVEEGHGPRGNRVDLARQLGVGIEGVPCAVPEDVDLFRLADAMERLARDEGGRAVDTRGLEECYPTGEDQFEHWLARLLGWLGLTPGECRWSRGSLDVTSPDTFARVRPRGISLSDVERFAGVASAHGQVRVLIGHEPPTRPAVAAAERLRIALFSLNCHKDAPCSAHSSLAHVLRPHGQPWQLPQPMEPDDFWV